jgi:hypothetical protein
MKNSFRVRRPAALLGWVLFFALSVEWAASATNSPPGPTLFLDQAGFDRIHNSTWELQVKQSQQFIREAEALLKDPPVIPSEGGGWIFDLYCPKDNALFHRVAPGVFVCPAEKLTNANPKAEAAWRTTQHDRAAQGAQTLALAYRLTSRREFAKLTADLLLRYAELYAGYVRHDRWGRTGFFAFMGGKRYAQALDEAVNLIPCAWAYDLIRDSDILTPESAAHIEDQFLRAAARELQVRTFQEDNNHQTWINAAIASVGFTLHDSALIDESISGRFGFNYQMNRCVTSDGLWHEGTMAYQRYAMEPLVKHVHMARRAGLKLDEDPRVRSLFDGPLLSAYPDGSYPIINDSDPFNIRSMADLYEWAFAVYGDPRYAAVAATGKRQSLWSWLVGRPELPATSGLVAQESRNLTGIGYLFMNGQSGPSPVSLVLDYGPHGGDHGHPDKLNLLLHAWGQDRFVDPGRITYSVPEYKSWCKQSIAHNTVTVDEKSQNPATGYCAWFGVNPKVQAACVGTDDAYGGIRLERMVGLTDRYILDCYRAVSDHQHTYDWALHIRGQSPLTPDFSALKMGLGTGDGYPHLEKVFTRKGLSPGMLKWPLDGTRAITLHVPQSKIPETWFMGQAIGTSLGERIPFLIRRQKTDTALWIAVYELTDQPSNTVQQVRFNGRATDPRPSLTISGSGWKDDWSFPWERMPGTNTLHPVSLESIPGFVYRSE